MPKQLMRVVAIFVVVGIAGCDTKATVTPKPTTAYAVATATSKQPTAIPVTRNVPTLASATLKAATQGVTLTALAGLNVRLCPGTACAVIGGLQKGDQAQAIGVNGDWYQIKYGVRSGWVYGDNVSVSGDTASLTAITLPTSPPSAPRPTSSSSNVQLPAATKAPAATRPPATAVPTKVSAGATCPGLSFTCSQLTCQQAYACLAAGNRSLDGDKDGIPCENICG